MKTIGKLKVKITCKKKSILVKKKKKNLVQGMYEHVYKKVDAVRRNGEKSLLQSRK